MKGGGVRKAPKYKKARVQKNPVGSVKMKDGKRYVKTDTGWRLQKSKVKIGAISRAEAIRLAKFNLLDEKDENILKQLQIGIPDEAEHSIADTVEKRSTIAAEHLREDPHYYTKLKGAGLMKSRLVLGKSEKKPKSGKKKIAYVMKEFAAGRLKSSDGKVVTDKKQALAIAYSEAGMKSIRERKGAILLKSSSPESPRLALGIHPQVESLRVVKPSQIEKDLD